VTEQLVQLLVSAAGSFKLIEGLCIAKAQKSRGSRRRTVDYFVSFVGFVSS
jgi:hypothetical protein